MRPRLLAIVATASLLLTVSPGSSAPDVCEGVGPIYWENPPPAVCEPVGPIQPCDHLPDGAASKTASDCVQEWLCSDNGVIDWQQPPPGACGPIGPVQPCDYLPEGNDGDAAFEEQGEAASNDLATCVRDAATELLCKLLVAPASVETAIGDCVPCTTNPEGCVPDVLSCPIDELSADIEAAYTCITGNPVGKPKIDPFSEVNGECTGTLDTLTQSGGGGFGIPIGDITIGISAEFTAEIGYWWTFACDGSISAASTGWDGLLRRVRTEYGGVQTPGGFCQYDGVTRNICSTPPHLSTWSFGADGFAPAGVGLPSEVEACPTKAVRGLNEGSLGTAVSGSRTADCKNFGIHYVVNDSALAGLLPDGILP
jgi:hypothetical protein